MSVYIGSLLSSWLPDSYTSFQQGKLSLLQLLTAVSTIICQLVIL